MTQELLSTDLLAGILVGLGMILGLKYKKDREDNDEKRLVKIPVKTDAKMRERNK